MNVLLIDINNTLFRGISVLPDLKYKEKSTGGFFKFLEIVSNTIIECDPTYIIGCADSPPYKRKEIFKEYKEFRKTPNKNVEEYEKRKKILNENRKHCYDFMRFSGINIISEEGFEADDIIAYYTKKYEKGGEIHILSGDDDLFQLLNKNVYIHQKKGKIYTIDSFKKDFDVSPSDMPLLLSIAGSHNGWKGIKGKGIKKAMDIIKDKEQLKKYKNMYREIISCGLKLITLPYEGLEVTQKLIKPTYNYKEMIKFLHQYGIILTGNIVEAFERYE